MNFYSYMMKTHIDSDSPEGDLARDMKRDSANFPRNKGSASNLWKERIGGYLAAQGACWEAQRVFKECWREYAHEMRLRKWKKEQP